MPSVTVRDMPADVHRRLKSAALQHHRSMNQEVITIIEEALDIPGPQELPPPVKTLKPISGDAIVNIIRNIRDRA